MPGLSGLSGLSGEQGIFGGGFSPRDIAGLLLWLKADAGVYEDAAKTIPATDDGDVIGAWEDQSSNGNDATQGTTANKPTLQNAAGDLVNGRPVISFDGANDYLDATVLTGTSGTAFVVMVFDDELVAPDVIYCASDDDTGGKWMNLAINNNGGPDVLDMYENIGTTGFYGSTDLDNGTYYIACYRSTGVTGSLWVNGNDEAEANHGGAYNGNWWDDITPPQGHYIGVRSNAGALTNYFKGNLGEMIIYNSTLSDANRQLVEQYLSNRWGIALS